MIKIPSNRITTVCAQQYKLNHSIWDVHLTRIDDCTVYSWRSFHPYSLGYDVLVTYTQTHILIFVHNSVPLNIGFLRVQYNVLHLSWSITWIDEIFYLLQFHAVLCDRSVSCLAFPRLAGSVFLITACTISIASWLWLTDVSGVSACSTNDDQWSVNDRRVHCVLHIKSVIYAAHTISIILASVMTDCMLTRNSVKLSKAKISVVGITWLFTNVGPLSYLWNSRSYVCDCWLAFRLTMVSISKPMTDYAEQLE